MGDRGGGGGSRARSHGGGHRGLGEVSQGQDIYGLAHVDAVHAVRERSSTGGCGRGGGGRGHRALEGDGEGGGLLLLSGCGLG